jgi:hypothetical protein
MSLSCTLFLAVLGAAAAYEVCSGKDTGCATGEIEDMGLLQFRTEQSGPIPECQNLSTNASAPSKCPTGTIVNPSLWCISNPSCPGTTGCVEGTGCQYVDAPNTSLLEKTTPSGPIPECQNLSTNASNASKCPTGTIVNPSLWCISNPSCPGTTGCVEGTGCQYVPAPAPALLQQSGPIPECQNLSTNASNASKCPTGTIVNPSLWCISNPSCPGTTGCVEGTGCQYVPAPAPALLQQSGPIPECQNLSTNASAPSKCPTGTIVNPSLYCISNPSCPGTTGCVEGTGCQYVDAPNTSMLEKM